MGKDPYYLAVDPGTHTGWAIWNEEGECIDCGTTHSDEALHNKLSEFTTIKKVIIEDYTLWFHKARKQAGSKMPAPKAIGIVETFARNWEADIIKQGSDIKPIAEKWTGRSTKGIPKSQTHVLDALNHGDYFLIKNDIKEIVL